jgi:hypothetical protein
MVRSLALVLILNGCGRYDPNGPDLNRFEIEDPDFLVYLRKFEQSSETRKPVKIVNIVIKYGNIGPSTVGLCTITSKTPPTITIDRSYWSKATSMEKETLMFHELGHCELKRKHRSDIVNGVPISLMYPNSIWNYYKQTPLTYQDELFSITGDWFNLIDEDENFKCEYEL